MSIEDDYQPIRALNDLLYCERRCALHRIEGIWTDNAATLEGTFAHKRADKPATWESAVGVREVHGMWLRSDRLRLVGKADVVEFHSVGEALRDSHSATEHAQDVQASSPIAAFKNLGHGMTELRSAAAIPFPVEYKRGKRRKWDNDDVQLCAQAICLEEMLGVAVPRGAIFHIKTKRRREVEFTPALRSLTEATAARLHELLASRITPLPVLKARCQGCSLFDFCMPTTLSESARIATYQRQLYQITSPTESS